MKKILPLICFIWMPWSFCMAQSSPKGKELILTDAEKADFTDQANRVVWNLGKDISIISDKYEDPLKRRAAIKLACKLFVNADSNIVEVSSLRPGVPNKFIPVRSYFDTLYKLPYAKVEIVWYHVLLSRTFERGADGRYYGIANISQKFTGSGNRDIGTYQDVTEKKIKIVIDLIDEIDGDTAEPQWRLFLGDIQVIETKQQ